MKQRRPSCADYRSAAAAAAAGGWDRWDGARGAAPPRGWGHHRYPGMAGALEDISTCPPSRLDLFAIPRSGTLGYGPDDTRSGPQQVLPQS
jgi:hypothetical protein